MSVAVATGTDLYTEYVLCTGEMAQRWLDESNVDNRRLRPAHVRRFMDLIMRGEWKLTHQGIAFDLEGRLRDGQHRLRAIAQTGVPCWIMVTYNLPVDAGEAIDQGLRRTSQDLLSVGPRVADTVSLCAGLIFSVRPLSGHQLREAYAIVGAEAEELIVVAGTTRRGLTTAGTKAAAVIRILEGERREYVHGQYKAISNLEFSDMQPISQAFVRQMSNVGKVVGGSGQQNDVFARSMLVFREDLRERTRITLTADVQSALLEEARSVMRRRA